MYKRYSQYEKETGTLQWLPLLRSILAQVVTILTRPVATSYQEPESF